MDEPYDQSRPPGSLTRSPRTWRENPVVVPHQPLKKIKSIEYYQDGTVKKIKYFETPISFDPMLRP